MLIHLNLFNQKFVAAQKVGVLAAAVRADLGIPHEIGRAHV